VAAEREKLIDYSFVEHLHYEQGFFRLYCELKEGSWKRTKPSPAAKPKAKVTTPKTEEGAELEWEREESLKFVAEEVAEGRLPKGTVVQHIDEVKECERMMQNFIDIVANLRDHIFQNLELRGEYCVETGFFYFFDALFSSFRVRVKQRPQSGNAPQGVGEGGGDRRSHKGNIGGSGSRIRKRTKKSRQYRMQYTGFVLVIFEKQFRAPTREPIQAFNVLRRFGYHRFTLI
jgi:hypothetical protein